MDCCQCRSIESHFDRQRVRKKLNAYRENGPDGTTRILLGALMRENLQGMTLLDVGGGVGVLQHELLQVGVQSANSVEASAASIELAQEEAVRQGHADRITYYHGDFTELAPELPIADIVTLDRVICCYHDMTALVRLSASRARRLYGVVYPRDTWWVKLFTLAENTDNWVRRDPFRLFVHSMQAVNALISEHGLKPSFEHQTRIWQIVVYKKAE